MSEPNVFGPRMPGGLVTRAAWWSTALLVGLVLLSGCQTASNKQEKVVIPDPVVESIPQPEGGLYGLRSMNGEPLLAGTKIQLQFKEQRVSGTGGANRYFANVAYTAPDQIQFSPIGSTRVHRAEPVGLMAQEAAYFAALQNVDRFAWDDEQRLILRGGGDAGVVLVFDRLGDAE